MKYHLEQTGCGLAELLPPQMQPIAVTMIMIIIIIIIIIIMHLFYSTTPPDVLLVLHTKDKTSKVLKKKCMASPRKNIKMTISPFVLKNKCVLRRASKDVSESACLTEDRREFQRRGVAVQKLLSPHQVV